MSDVLGDRSKFEKIHDDMFPLLLKSEDKINHFLRKLKKANVIDDKLFSELFVSGARPGIMYGLPKVHKEGCPTRPILSAIGTFNYNLSKYLVPILAPLTVNCHTVTDSFTWARELSTMNSVNCTMASFDVKSLFTNIPLDETINICTDELYKGVEYVNGFSKSQFHRLLSLAAKDCYFIFDGLFYKQHDGVAMGSPLGPTLANAFLSYYEIKWLSDCPLDFKPTVYKRYVDDTFLLFRSPDHIPQFLEYLNSKHPNIEFTSEKENNNKLSFLDISVEKNGGSFRTSVYRKPTFTGLTTKFSSSIPFQYKINLIATLVTRAYRICYDYVNLHLELEYLKKTLKLNGFPVALFERITGRQLSKLISPSNKPVTVNRALVYFPIQYHGKHSYSIRNKLVKLLSEFYPQVKVRVIFKCNNTLQRFFRFKDRLPDALQSNLVYFYECGRCTATYLGQTKRLLRVRIADHQGRSFRTNYPLSKPPFSAIHLQGETTDHPLLADNLIS